MFVIFTTEEKNKMQRIRARISELCQEVKRELNRPRRHRLENRINDMFNFSKILFSKIDIFEKTRNNKDRQEINFLLKSFRIYEKKPPKPRTPQNMNFILKFD